MNLLQFIKQKPSKDMNIDNPDELDIISYDDFFGEEGGGESIIKYDINIIEDNLVVFSQLIQSLTNMACGCYGATHCINAMNLIEANSLATEYEQINPLTLWEEFLIKNPSSLYEGSSLQDWIAVFKNKGFISGSVRAYSIEEAKKAIDNNRLIYTGSNNGDWKKVKSTGIYGIKTKSYGHLFCLVGYNDKGFIGVNSLNDGYFILPYEYWNTLYSRNVLLDKVNQEAINELNKIIDEIKKLDYKNGLFKYYEYSKRKYSKNKKMFDIVKKLLRRKFINKDL